MITLYVDKDKVKSGRITRGERYPTNNSGDIEILENNGIMNIQVRFVQTGNIRTATHSNIRDGKVADTERPFSCSVCDENDVRKFRKDRKAPTGLATRCRVCEAAAKKKRDRSFEGKIKKLYSGMKDRTRKHGHKEQVLPKEEFMDWVLTETHYAGLHERWVEGEYVTELSPSIDRIENTIGYIKTNIRMCTWEENHKAMNKFKSHYFVLDNIKTGELKLVSGKREMIEFLRTRGLGPTEINMNTNVLNLAQETGKLGNWLVMDYDGFSHDLSMMRVVDVADGKTLIFSNDLRVLSYKLEVPIKELLRLITTGEVFDGKQLLTSSLTKR